MRQVYRIRKGTGDFFFVHGVSQVCRGKKRRFNGKTLFIYGTGGFPKIYFRVVPSLY